MVPDKNNGEAEDPDQSGSYRDAPLSPEVKEIHNNTGADHP
jgi:hypothetical protein